ncbi:MAG: DUF4199 domain-containing protein [Capnocytophaga felis]|nr:DUF4199 domain-containing protein [Capnocytophaga felis]
METNVVNSKDIMLKNGLYLGLAIVLVNVVMYASGMIYNGNTVVGILSSVLKFGLMVFFIVLGIKQFRTQNSGFLMLGQALKVGVGIALVMAIIEVLYSLIFTTVIEPDFFDKMLEVQKAAMIEANPNLTEQQLDGAIEMSRKFTSPVFTLPISIVWNLFLGLVISLIAGAVMQKKEQEY